MAMEKIINILKQNMPVFRERYNVNKLELFGSYVRGNQDKDSDIDILVEFDEVIDLFKFIELEEFLSELLCRKVDLVMKDTLKSRIRDSVLKEAISI